MKYAKVDENGIVTNIFVAEPEQAKKLGAIRASRDPIGEIYGRADKLAEISQACRAAILAGCDVTLADGTIEHFALEEADQINLAIAVAACQQGANDYPYHADGKLFRMYSAADIVAIDRAAAAHKLYHTVYCNHLMMWARRAKTADDLKTIAYGADLPVDLAESMDALLGGDA